MFSHVCVWRTPHCLLFFYRRRSLSATPTLLSVMVKWIDVQNAVDVVGGMFFRIAESNDVYCTWPDPDEDHISINSFHYTLMDAEHDCYENADGRTTVLITSQSIEHMAMGRPLDVLVWLGPGNEEFDEYGDGGYEAVDLETVVGWLLEKGFIVREPSPDCLYRGDPNMRLLEVRTPYHPRLCWEMLRTRWLPHWKLTNYWWRIAGEGQHHADGLGAKRSREEWEALCDEW